MNWDTYFFAMAELVATKSKDPSTKVGCVIVGPDNEVRSTGFNGLPRGVEDRPNRYDDRALKYEMIVHAEVNAVAHAARIGASLKGCTAYVLRPPCSMCAACFIQAGVDDIRCIEPPAEWLVSDKWGKNLRLAQTMLLEAGIMLRFYCLLEDGERYQVSVATLPPMAPR